jgi:hypothetical protein
MSDKNALGFGPSEMDQFAGLAGAPDEHASPDERENAHATCSHNSDPEARGGSITSHLNRQNMVDHVRVCQSREQYGESAGESQNSHRTSLHIIGRSRVC